MQLEQMAAPGAAAAYPFTLIEPASGAAAPVEVDWRPAVLGLLEDLGRGTGVATVAGRFHRTLAQMIAAVAEWAGLHRVVLTGGFFQNASVASLAARELARLGFEVVKHRRIPPNDGGLAVGQALVAASQLLERGN
jgi:hydrogenase maturation protein HypF